MYAGVAYSGCLKLKSYLVYYVRFPRLISVSERRGTPGLAYASKIGEMYKIKLRCFLRTRMHKVTTTSGKVFRRVYRLGYQQLVCYSRLFFSQQWNGLGMKLATHIHVGPKLSKWMIMYTLIYAFLAYTGMAESSLNGSENLWFNIFRVWLKRSVVLWRMDLFSSTCLI
jgi:hypothetical protein